MNNIFIFFITDADLVVAAVAGDDGPGHGHVGVVVIVLRLDEVVPHLDQSEVSTAVT